MGKKSIVLSNQDQAVDQNRPRFNILQALRFMAALSVIIFHSGHYLKANAQRPDAYLPVLNDPLLAYGVYLFFAISGFVLTQALERSTIPEFLALRFLRIYPAFWGAVLLSWLIRHALFGAPFIFDWWSLTLLPFGVLPYPLGIEWSLVYEIFFYVMLAAMASPRSPMMLKLSLVGWVILILGGYYIVGWPLTEPLPTIKTILFSLMNLSFIAGIISHQVYTKVTRHRWILLLVSAITLFLARTTSNPLVLFFGLAVGCGALVTFAAAQATVRDLATTSPLVKLGDYSYGMYLLHVPTMLALLMFPFTVRIPTWILTIAFILLSLIAGSVFGWAELRLYKLTKRLVMSPMKPRKILRIC